MPSPIIVTPTTVSIQVGGPSANVTVQQTGAGFGAFSVSGGNSAVATAILASFDGPGPVVLIITAVTNGTTAWTVNGAGGFTQNVVVIVSPSPIPASPFVGPESQFPFLPQASESNPQAFAYDVVISEPFPGVVFEGTEPNQQYQEIREVSGDLWLVTNAQFNLPTLTFQQNSPCNPADPAYALRLRANGDMIRYSAVATTAPGITVTWVQMFEVDGAGNVFTTPLTQTVPIDSLQVSPTWNVGTPNTTGSFEQDVTDTSSAANSFLEKFTVNGTTVWQVRKDGTLVVGTVPFASITGFTLPPNQTLSGTTTFNGPVVDNSSLDVYGPTNLHGGLTVEGGETVNGLLTANNGLNVSGGESVTGGLTTDSEHVTGSSQVDGNLTTNGTITGGSLVLSGANPIFSYVGETIQNISRVALPFTAGVKIPRNSPAEGWSIDVKVVASPGAGAGGTVSFIAGAFISSGGPFTDGITPNQIAAASGSFTASSTASLINQPQITISYAGSPIGNVLLIMTAVRGS
jgi:hypothetical protein